VAGAEAVCECSEKCAVVVWCSEKTCAEEAEKK